MSLVTNVTVLWLGKLFCLNRPEYPEADIARGKVLRSRIAVLSGMYFSGFL